MSTRKKATKNVENQPFTIGKDGEVLYRNLLALSELPWSTETRSALNTIVVMIEGTFHAGHKRKRTPKKAVEFIEGTFHSGHNRKRTPRKTSKPT
jgi:hypothetical protein